MRAPDWCGRSCLYQPRPLRLDRGLRTDPQDDPLPGLLADAQPEWALISDRLGFAWPLAIAVA